MTMRDLGLLALRLTAGGLMAGHGAQKLFGAFGGHGLEGTAGWLESLGLKPGTTWALIAGGSELGAGVLTALGLLSPAGSLGMLAPMAIATGKVHAGKPIWVSEGGAELPVVNMAAGVALALTGPGKYSLDRALGIRLPAWASALTLAAVTGGVAYTLAQPGPAPETERAEVAGAELQGGVGAAAGAV
jgi:putative oxidoreductase